MMRLFRVGELAKRTGLTVRTLHHYDEIGLLEPSRRSAAGYRLYGEEDVVRLQQILSLRQLGLGLDQVREFLVSPESSVKHVVALQLARLQEQIRRTQSLCELLEKLQHRLDQAEEVSVDDFLFTIEAMTMYDKYFTPGQREQLEERGRVVGQERIAQVEQDWPALIAQVRAEMEKGTDPSDPVVRRLAERWMALVNEFTGGDPQLEQSVRRLYQEEPAMREKSGIEPDIMEYIARAKPSSSE
jgi:DNA-binding transcriptional MerR regulator